MDLDKQNDTEVIDRFAPQTAESSLGEEAPADQATAYTRPRRPRPRAARFASRAGFALLCLALVAAAGLFLGLTVWSQTRPQKIPKVEYAQPVARPIPMRAPAQPAAPNTPLLPAPSVDFSQGEFDPTHRPQGLPIAPGYLPPAGGRPRVVPPTTPEPQSPGTGVGAKKE